MQILGPAIQDLMTPSIQHEARNYRRAATTNDAVAILSETTINRAIEAVEHVVEKDLANRIFARCWRGVYAICDNYMETRDREDLREVIKEELRADDQLRDQVRAELFYCGKFRRDARKNLYGQDIQNELRREFKTAVVNHYYEWHAESIRSELRDADHAKEYVDRVLPGLFQDGRVSQEWVRANMSDAWVRRYARASAPSPPAYYRDIGTYTSDGSIPRSSAPATGRSAGPSRGQKLAFGVDNDDDRHEERCHCRSAKSPHLTYDNAGLSSSPHKEEVRQPGVPLLWSPSKSGCPMTKSHPLADREHHPEHLQGLGELRDGVLGYPLRKPTTMDSDWKRRALPRPHVEDAHGARASNVLVPEATTPSGTKRTRSDDDEERPEERRPAKSPRFNLNRSGLTPADRRHASASPFSTQSSETLLEGRAQTNSLEIRKTDVLAHAVHRPVQSQTLPLSPRDGVPGLPPRKPLLIHQCKKWQARQRRFEEETARTRERGGHRRASNSPSTLEGESDDEGDDTVWDEVDALEESLDVEADEEGEMDNENDIEDEEQMGHEEK